MASDGGCLAFGLASGFFSRMNDVHAHADRDFRVQIGAEVIRTQAYDRVWQELLFRMVVRRLS